MQLKKFITETEGNPRKSYYDRLSMAESGGNDKAVNPTPGATASGRYQFIASTWEDMVKKYNLNYTLDDRFNPEKSQKVIELFTRDNEKELSKALKRPLNDTDLYTAHFLGVGGAKSFYKNLASTPNKLSTEYFSEKALRGNKGMMFNKDGSPKTLQQVHSEIARRIGGDGEIANISEVSTTEPKQQEFTDLQFSNYLPNFVGMIFSEEDKETADDKVVKEVEKELQKEDRKLNAFDNFAQQQEQILQAIPQQQVEDTFSAVQTFQGIEQFVGQPLLQNGGLVVSSKNDPRYKAYQDSLTLYNQYRNTKNLIVSGGKYYPTPELSKPIQYNTEQKRKVENPNNPIEYKKVTNSFGYNAISSKGNKDIDVTEVKGIKPLKTETYTRKESQYKSEKEYNEASKKIKDFSERPGKANWIGYDIQQYKKPTQPVTLQPLQIRDEKSISQINPAELQSSNTLFNAPELVERIEAIIPTSYDVRGERYSMIGENPYYDFNIENADVDTAIRAKEASDAYNKFVQDRYKNSNHPNAIERLDKLRQDVTISPNFQLGGAVIPNRGLIPIPKVNTNKKAGFSVGNSNINGKGVLSNSTIKNGTLLGISHTNNQPSSELGMYHNHSENPNARSVKLGNSRYIITNKDIKDGEEITVDYRLQPELEQPKKDWKQ